MEKEENDSLTFVGVRDADVTKEYMRISGEKSGNILSAQPR